MSPEQAASPGDVREASDVYSIGATLYAMLTGRPPFLGRSVGETLQQLIYSDPVPPDRLNAAVSRDLEVICLKCLEKEPARRYPTAGLLYEDLRRYLGDQPVSARPMSSPAKLARSARRNPIVAALVAAVVLLLTLLMIVLAVFLSGRRP
jgi:serine/threonine protein kinase